MIGWQRGVPRAGDVEIIERFGIRLECSVARWRAADARPLLRNQKSLDILRDCGLNDCPKLSFPSRFRFSTSRARPDLLQ